MIKSTQPRYNITFIGAGRVAHHLAPALYDAGHKIVQIYSRNIENAKILANMVGAEPICKYDDVNKLSNIYIYCISDDAVQWVMNHIHVHEGLHIHTSGSLSMDIFKKTRTDYGCLYPLQTFSK
ncbi:MAG: NAD(P)-binding domain-containing protein, partial [Paludibacteraceae bacterium]|nr:NAD(P)-binding domain-containing protein [Paludibacteraceae bacterium]